MFLWEPYPRLYTVSSYDVKFGAMDQQDGLVARLVREVAAAKAAVAASYARHWRASSG